SRRRHTRLQGDWSSDVCSSDLINSTVSGNATSVGAGVTGGGILNVGGTVTLANSTVIGNTDSNPLGGGIFNYSGAISLKNTIVRSEERRVGKECRTWWVPRSSK